MINRNDIARLAGVSCGTVSNVFSGKGNVSAEKIARVMEAARQLGYSPDDRARRLRQGQDHVVGVILPNIIEKGYAILFTAIASQLAEVDCHCELYLTGDIPAQEEAALTKLSSKRASGVVLISCQPNGSPARDSLQKAGIQLVTLVRETSPEGTFIGFDLKQIALRAQELLAGSRHVSIITGLLAHRNESALLEMLQDAFEDKIQITSYQTDLAGMDTTAYTCMSADVLPDTILTTSPSIVPKLRDSCAFYHIKVPKLITLCPATLARTGSETPCIELDWKQMAQAACRMLSGEEKGNRILLPIVKPEDAFPIPIASPQKLHLRALMMDGPDTKALSRLLPDFKARTGMDVSMTILPYQKLYREISDPERRKQYDILRLDVAWLNTLAEDMLRPFNPADDVVRAILSPMLKAVRIPFSTVGERVYAFPFTPNVQLFFYRKDIFEDTIIRRQYYEKQHRQLASPQDYAEYCDLLHFFDRSENPDSPVEFGAALVLSAVQCVSGEFLPCLYSHHGQLFNEWETLALDETILRKTLDCYADMYTHTRHIDDAGFWGSGVKCFTHGETAMLNMFINHVYGIANLRKSRIAGQIGFASLPGGNPLLGGGVLGVNQDSAHPEAALEFIRWACGEHVAVPFTMLGGISPCSSIYENQDILDLYPWLRIVPENLARAHVRKVPSDINEYSVEEIIGTAVYDMVQGKHTSEETAKRIYENLEALLK